MSTFVLVHGSWQGGWAWEEVARRLEARGHRALAPTLPGHHRPGEDRARIGHDDLVAAVLATLEDAGPGPVVLVGHSLGGAVIGQVADRRPDRVARLVYCDAFVLRDGEAVADLVPASFHLPRLAGLDLPATFIHLRQDRTMPPGFWHPGMSGRLPGAALIELDGDHQAMLTAPRPLADALHWVAISVQPPAARRPEATADA